MSYPSFWGKPTASLDWCETNYQYSPFIAEFWNTVSSLWLTFLAAFGIYQAAKMRVDKRLYFAYLALGVVGIGSAMFHATLLYSCQLLDELPMIYGTLIFLYAVFEFEKHSAIQRMYIPALVVLGTLITVVMLLNKSMTMIHQVAYAVLVGVLVLRAFYITYLMPDLSNMEQLNFRYLFWYSAVTFSSGYVSWLTERKLCYNGYVITGIQLHSLWHILTGIGTFGLIQFITYFLLKDRTVNMQFSYLFHVIPYVDQRPRKTA